MSLFTSIVPSSTKEEENKIDPKPLIDYGVCVKCIENGDNDSAVANCAGCSNAFCLLCIYDHLAVSYLYY